MATGDIAVSPPHHHGGIGSHEHHRQLIADHQRAAERGPHQVQLSAAGGQHPMDLVKVSPVQVKSEPVDHGVTSPLQSPTDTEHPMHHQLPPTPNSSVGSESPVTRYAPQQFPHVGGPHGHPYSTTAGPMVGPSPHGGGQVAAPGHGHIPYPYMHPQFAQFHHHAAMQQILQEGHHGAGRQIIEGHHSAGRQMIEGHHGAGRPPMPTADSTTAHHLQKLSNGGGKKRKDDGNFGNFFLWHFGLGPEENYGNFFWETYFYSYGTLVLSFGRRQSIPVFTSSSSSVACTRRSM